ncbi:cuticle collagen 2C-like [Dipodomys merriami]|uniref:cuticle collagen 2C-like n=1 Tax=Dipodomys merriami TaxID=94247 RepID=UPI003855CFEE
MVYIPGSVAPRPAACGSPHLLNRDPSREPSGQARAPLGPGGRPLSPGRASEHVQTGNPPPAPCPPPAPRPPPGSAGRSPRARRPPAAPPQLRGRRQPRGSGRRLRPGAGGVRAPGLRTLRGCGLSPGTQGAQVRAPPAGRDLGVSPVSGVPWPGPPREQTSLCRGGCERGGTAPT